MSEHFPTAVEIARAIRSGELTATAAATACLERIDRRDPEVHAWAYVDPDSVLAAARDLDSSAIRGPLHGVPIGVKDVIGTKDMPTRHNSPIHAGNAREPDAACVQTLRAAGALVLGKTVTTEFAATASGGPTRNPHDGNRTPGGSSSGSGAAVADGQVPVALATQTGGSTIRPGSFTGVVAFKPTWNAISREGLKVFVPSTDTLGFCTRSVADLELLADVYRLVDRVPPHDIAGGPRIAVYRSPAWPMAEQATVDAMDLATTILTDSGAQVHELTLSSEFDDVLDIYTDTLLGEARVSFLSEAAAHPELLRDEFAAWVDERNTVTRADLIDAYDRAATLRKEFDRAAMSYDAVLTPSVPGEAPLGLASTGSPAFCSMWALLQTPVINLPGFAGENDMPVGLSLVSARYTDRQLIKVAAQIEPLFALHGSWGARTPRTSDGRTQQEPITTAGKATR